MPSIFRCFISRVSNRHLNEEIDPGLAVFDHERKRPVCHVYFVESGVASILTIMTDGASIEVGMTGSEGMVGVVSLLDPQAVASRVIVQVPGKALRMPVGRKRSSFSTLRGVMAMG
jgi:CRP-like cAMP-binding protein